MKHWLYSTPVAKNENGIGFMVYRWAVGSEIAFKPISDWLAGLTIASAVKFFILSTYAPTKTSLDTVKDDFYNQLKQTLETIPWTKLILTADFKAHIGADRTG